MKPKNDKNITDINNHSEIPSLSSSPFLDSSPSSPPLSPLSPFNPITSDDDSTELDLNLIKERSTPFPTKSNKNTPHTPKSVDLPILRYNKLPLVFKKLDKKTVRENFSDLEDEFYKGNLLAVIGTYDENKKSIQEFADMTQRNSVSNITNKQLKDAGYMKAKFTNSIHGELRKYLLIVNYSELNEEKFPRLKEVKVDEEIFYVADQNLITRVNNYDTLEKDLPLLNPNDNSMSSENEQHRENRKNKRLKTDQLDDHLSNFYTPISDFRHPKTTTIFDPTTYRSTNSSRKSKKKREILNEKQESVKDNNFKQPDFSVLKELASTVCEEEYLKPDDYHNTLGSSTPTQQRTHPALPPQFLSQPYVAGAPLMPLHSNLFEQSFPGTISNATYSGAYSMQGPNYYYQQPQYSGVIYNSNNNFNMNYNFPAPVQFPLTNSSYSFNLQPQVPQRQPQKEITIPPLSTSHHTLFGTGRANISNPQNNANMNNSLPPIHPFLWFNH